jgi:hypothetical protein
MIRKISLMELEMAELSELELEKLEPSPREPEMVAPWLLGTEATALEGRTLLAMDFEMAALRRWPADAIRQEEPFR